VCFFLNTSRCSFDTDFEINDLQLGVLNIPCGFPPNLKSVVYVENHNIKRQSCQLFEFARFISPTILKGIDQFGSREFQKLVGGIRILALKYINDIGNCIN